MNDFILLNYQFQFLAQKIFYVKYVSILEIVCRKFLSLGIFVLAKVCYRLVVGVNICMKKTSGVFVKMDKDIAIQ